MRCQKGNRLWGICTISTHFDIQKIKSMASQNNNPVALTELMRVYLAVQ